MSGSFKVIRSSSKTETEVSKRAKRAIVATRQERRESLPGDDVVSHPRSSYTLAVTVGAARSEIWPWLVQMGQGRAGFYTHVWVERLLGAEIENADEIVSGLQHLAIGDVVRLTPDPYRGHPGQYMTVVHLKARRSLVFSQTLPNGSRASWAFVLRTAGVASTRLLLRRRSERPTWFDRVLRPGYIMMDAGVLRGLRKRAEAGSRRARLARVGLPVMRRRGEGDVRRP